MSEINGKSSGDDSRNYETRTSVWWLFPRSPYELTCFFLRFVCSVFQVYHHVPCTNYFGVFSNAEVPVAHHQQKP